MDKDNIFTIMEYCQHDLESFFKRKTPNPKKLTELEIRFYFSQIIEAFKNLRTKNKKHKSIKPYNIFVKNNVWKIGDFSFAKRRPDTIEDLRFYDRNTLLYDRHRQSDIY
ncbi:hypothetical protein ABPG72_020638 [Tetrahymena utriculariae]